MTIDRALVFVFVIVVVFVEGVLLDVVVVVEVIVVIIIIKAGRSSTCDVIARIARSRRGDTAHE